jgi:minor extracellular serine protease Vpr
VKRLIPLASVLLVVLLTAAAAGAGTRAETDGGTAPATIDSGSALVQLRGDALLTNEKTKPAHGKKVDFSSGQVRSYRAQLAALRNDFKQWLRQNAPAAKVTGEFDVALNAVSVELNGATLQTIRSAPQVVSAELQNIYRPMADNDPDLSLIHAWEAWQLSPGGWQNTGDGVKIAIIDTGIDVRHPCFTDAGYPEGNAPDRIVNGGTNDKVIYAEVFNNKAGNRGYGTADVNGHGTHVAGTAACNAHTDATYSTRDTPPKVVAIPYDPSGVAPRALLGNFNVFPADVANARSEDILNALQRAYELGFDVANMSLGGGSRGVQDLLSHAINRFDRGGMVSAVAAGNEGPGDETVSSPGFAERAIAAGASTVGHFVGSPVTVAGAGTFGAASGEFETVDADLTAPLDPVTQTVSGALVLDTLCSPLPAGSLAGKIALVARGVCTFTTKVRNAENAGAVAILIANNVAGDPVAMAHDGTSPKPTIPAYMVGKTTGELLKDKEGAATTIGASLQYFNTDNDNIMAGFSSRGPTDVNFRVKPDVVAPGVNVFSSQPFEILEDGELRPTCGVPPCWAFFQGTSMATPHIAGSAAVVIHQHPSWTAADVRSAIVNTARRGVLLDFQTGTQILDNPNIIGSGLEDLLNAVTAKVSLDPVSLAFGGVPSGSGQNRSGDFVVTNLSGATATFTFAVQDPFTGGLAYTVSPASVTLAPGATATIRVDVNVPRGHATPNDWAWLIVSMNGTEVAHAALYTRVT